MPNSGNPFGRWMAGTPVPGIPAALMNAILDLIQREREGQPKARAYTSTEIGVRNSSGSAVTSRFGVLQIGAPSTTQAENDSEFAESRILVGTTPAAGQPFAILHEPLTVGTIGRATVLGVVPCKVNMVATTDRFADCTTATDKLTSAATGPARILWNEDNFAGTGDKWAVVELLGQAAGSGPTIAFTEAVTWLAGGPFTRNSTVGTTTGLYLVAATFVGGATFGLGFPAQWIVTQFQPAVTGGATVNNTPFWVAMGATIPASTGAGVPVVCANTTCSGATTLLNLVEITNMGVGGTVTMATGITYSGTAGTDQLQFKFVSTKLR